MTSIQDKNEILIHLKNVRIEFCDFCSKINDERFFNQPTAKWSIAQNVTHLITSAKMTKLAYQFPKFIVRIYVGKPNRPSRGYDELVAKYNLKLQNGGKASGKFIAKPVSARLGKNKIIDTLNKSMTKLESLIEKKWNDHQLDQYLAPHPLLGKITLRELSFFTIYHIEHHLNIMRERLSD